MKILREKLEEREGEAVSVSPEVNSRIWENGIERPPAKLEVEVVETSDGLRAVLPGAEVEEPEEGEEDETEESEDGETEDVDYEEIVSGTVSEAKEELQELDSLDWEAALEAEEENKDRKTLKEWIENQQ